MTRMVQTELVRQQHDRRHMLLNSVQEMTDSVYTTKAELFHMETKALQVEGQDTLQDRSRPLSERMEDMDYIYERVAKAEQGIILVEAATIRSLAGATHEPAEMPGDVPTLALRQELEQQKEAIVAFPTLISQTVEAKLAALPRPKVTYLGLWSTVLAVFILLGFTVSQVYFYTRIQKINSNQIPLLTQLAEENLTSDNPEAAIPLLEQIADLDPGNISVLTKLGDAYLAKRQFANAIGAYNEAVKVDNSNFAALNGLGWSYLLAGQSAQAIPVLEKAVNIRANASSLTALGRAYAEKGRCEQAQPYLKKALELQPDRQDALDTLAVCGD
ncbi:MAG: tetratricopeptide repeat protein [Chloroflexi bacterium]|nr:tetratricopeptide repeat protein [Chloroflexota bacterium]